jgi:hypothetical protein
LRCWPSAISASAAARATALVARTGYHHFDPPPNISEQQAFGVPGIFLSAFSENHKAVRSGDTYNTVRPDSEQQCQVAALPNSNGAGRRRLRALLPILLE